MAASWLIGLVFLAVNVLMVVVLVISNSDFCASVFETQTGKLKPVTLWNGFENFVVSLGANKITLFYEVWSKVDCSLLHPFNTRHFNKFEMMNSHNKHLKTIFFPGLYLVLNLLKTFITYFTSDDSRLTVSNRNFICMRVYLFIIKDYIELFSYKTQLMLF